MLLGGAVVQACPALNCSVALLLRNYRPRLFTISLGANLALAPQRFRVDAFVGLTLLGFVSLDQARPVHGRAFFKRERIDRKHTLFGRLHVREMAKNGVWNLADRRIDRRGLGMIGRAHFLGCIADVPQFGGAFLGREKANILVGPARGAQRRVLCFYCRVGCGSAICAGLTGR